VKKTYDTARTPYRRLLESSFIDEPTKSKLRRRYAVLNPAALKRKIERLQQQLTRTAMVQTRTSKSGPLASSTNRARPKVAAP